MRESDLYIFCDFSFFSFLYNIIDFVNDFWDILIAIKREEKHTDLAVQISRNRYV